MSVLGRKDHGEGKRFESPREAAEQDMVPSKKAVDPVLCPLQPSHPAPVPLPTKQGHALRRQREDDVFLSWIWKSSMAVSQVGAPKFRKTKELYPPPSHMTEWG